MAAGRGTNRLPAFVLVVSASGRRDCRCGQWPPYLCPQLPPQGALPVHVLPLQPQRLALAEAEGQGDHPAGAVALPASGFEQQLDLNHGVRLDLVVIDRRRLSQLGGVLGNVAAADRLFQRRPQRPVDLMDSPGTHQRAALGRQLAHGDVEATQVFRPERVEAMAADAGNEVLPHRGAVALVSALFDEGPSDVLQPVLRARPDRPAVGDLTELALVPRLLRCPDLLDDNRLGSGDDVPPVDSSLVGQSDGDAAVPVIVATLLELRKSSGGCPAAPCGTAATAGPQFFEEGDQHAIKPTKMASRSVGDR